MESMTGSKDKDGAAFFSLSVEQSSRLLSSVFSLESKSSLLLLPSVSQVLRPNKLTASATKMSDDQLREELAKKTNTKPRRIIEEIRKGQSDYVKTAQDWAKMSVNELVSEAKKKQDELTAFLASLNISDASTNTTSTQVSPSEEDKKDTEDDSPENLNYVRKQDFFGIDCESDKLTER